ncbi:DUF397 domain-containing protein [Streptomyces flavidovirens]|uniref:DUF397 domain-containing protein n=1 Tax=Streptomyces flavidovirens TaxID=67298 RepID=UPI00369AF026
MRELYWQKSSFSSEASSCIYLASIPDSGVVALCESDEPGIVISTGVKALDALISALKEKQGRPCCRAS